MKRCREVGRVGRIACHGEQSRLPVRCRNSRLHGWANRTVADNLAQRADGTVYRSRVQVASPSVRSLAHTGDFVMMVKDFSGVEMKLAREQHTHDQGMNPEPESRFSTASHFTSLLCLRSARLIIPKFENCCLRAAQKGVGLDIQQIPETPYRWMVERGDELSKMFRASGQPILQCEAKATD